MLALAGLSLAGALAACAEPSSAQAKGAAAGERPTPSGLPVPRWVTLKFGEVNARAGPGDDHRKLWVYRVKGLPVQVVAETREWRRVCDGEGGLAWVHKRVTTGERNVLNLSRRPIPLQTRPRSDADRRGWLAAGALASLDACEAGWCRVRAGRVRGWAPAPALWGTAETTLCGAPPRRR